METDDLPARIAMRHRSLGNFLRHCRGAEGGRLWGRRSAPIKMFDLLGMAIAVTASPDDADYQRSESDPENSDQYHFRKRTGHRRRDPSTIAHRRDADRLARHRIEEPVEKEEALEVVVL